MKEDLPTRKEAEYMQVIHPQGSIYPGVAPENTFLAMSDQGTQIGSGYIVFQNQPNMYPDCPINMYFTLNSTTDEARYQIFGALIARARQLRDSNVNVRARFYTAIAPTDNEEYTFYVHSDFTCQDTENLYRLQLPQQPMQLPAGMFLEPAPLHLDQHKVDFLNRLAAQDVSYIDMSYLNQLMQQPVFHAVGMFLRTPSQNVLVGEALLAGNSSRCELQAIYIQPAFRSQGLGAVLANQCMAIAAGQGATDFYARFMSGSTLQRRLVKALGGVDMGAEMVYPSLYL